MARDEGEVSQAVNSTLDVETVLQHVFLSIGTSNIVRAPPISKVDRDRQFQDDLANTRRAQPAGDGIKSGDGGDPFVVTLALPATFCGIVMMLYIYLDDIERALAEGAIMTIGVGSANSILLVTFAREQQLAGALAFAAAITAGRYSSTPLSKTPPMARSCASPAEHCTPACPNV